MQSLPILGTIEAELQPFGEIPRRLRTKLTGALAVEVVRELLLSHQLPVSRRDVFIQGIPTEFDLFVTRPGAEPRYGLIYQPHDVLGVIEVKYTGIFGGEAVPKLREQFNRVVSLHGHIRCYYFTLMEMKGYKHRATLENLGHPVHTAYWRNSRGDEHTATGELESLLEALRLVLGKEPARSPSDKLKL